MDAHKISVKFYVEDDSQVAERDFVPVLHSWIQLRAVPDHLLIDVSDYAHMPNGPGVLLVSHEANFYVDELDGRLGLTYSRKQPVAGSFADRFRQATAAAREACKRLEEDPQLGARVKFRTDEATLRINDRLLAPNSPETFASVQREIAPLLRELFGADVKLEHKPSPEKLFEVHITAANSPALSR